MITELIYYFSFFELSYQFFRLSEKIFFKKKRDDIDKPEEVNISLDKEKNMQEATRLFKKEKNFIILGMIFIIWEIMGLFTPQPMSMMFGTKIVLYFIPTIYIFYAGKLDKPIYFMNKILSIAITASIIYNFYHAGY